jgi:hypothetical protein
MDENSGKTKVFIRKDTVNTAIERGKEMEKISFSVLLCVLM